MRAVCLLVLVTVVSAETQSSGSPLPAVDLAGAALNSFSEMTKQINQIQSVLSQLNGQMSKMIVMSTRLISVPAVRAADPETREDRFPGIPAGGLAGSMFETINRLTGQLSVIQNTIQQMTGQLQRVVETSTRMITGPALMYQEAGSVPGNVVESILRTFQSWNSQLEQMNGVLRGMSQQWNRVIQTGTKMITGSGGAAFYQAGDSSSESSSTPAPSSTSSSGLGLPSIPSLPAGVPGAAQIQSFFNLLSGQFSAVQKVLTDFSSQLTRMVTFGSGPTFYADQTTGGPAPAPDVITSPGDSVLTVIRTLTQQFQQIQSVLTELNQQMNKMIQTGSKAMG